MKYYGLTGVMYQAEDSHIKKGGEACIYKVIDKPDLLLKIYHSPARQQEQKLKVLLRQVTHWSSQFLAYCTIPIDLIYEADPRNGNARFVGYLMNRLPGNFRELQEIYDRIHGADVSYPNKVTAAMNVCTLTYLAHENHVVIGDYQQKNIGVANNGILTLFDNDSFQIQEKGRTYRCTVGVPQEMAPEIYDVLKKTKSDLETVPVSVYTNETDLYTMALHIFHLLMNGAHPFSSRIEASALPESKTVSKVQLDFVQMAMSKYFIFAHPTAFRKPPKWAPDYHILSKNLQELFERAFIDGRDTPSKRPTPEEFYDALQDYRNGLIQLPCGHYVYKQNYYAMNNQCSWCKIK